MAKTDVLVTGAGLLPFGKHLDRSFRSLASEVAVEAVKDAGLAVDDIDAVVFSNSVAGLVTGQEAIRGQTSLKETGLLGKPIFNVENACASGSSAFYFARSGLLGGLWRNVLVVGAEKMFHRDRTVTYRALAAAADVSERQGTDHTSSIFMELYAEHTRAYMARTGTTVEDYAWVVVKNHEHPAHNPIAQYRNQVSVDEVLQSADLAYEEASLGPEDIDVAEVHDAAAPAELECYEWLGFCPPGDGVKLVKEEATRLGGRLPVNTSGGLISRGHPIGATGVAQLAEIVLQLRDAAGQRQVDGTTVGLVQNAGGDVGGFGAASAVHILQSA